MITYQRDISAFVRRDHNQGWGGLFEMVHDTELLPDVVVQL